MKRLAVLAALLAAPLAVRAAPSPKPAPPASTYAAQYRKMLGDPYWRKSFPALGKFEVLAPSTGGSEVRGAYNCIAHTLRVYDRWVWPGKTVADFDRLYGQAGHRRVRGLDYRFSPRLEKVVLYAKVQNGQVECTHGARQLADGTWTSKLGGGPLIRHASPSSVAGESYGKPIAVYVRPRGSSTPARPAAPRPGTIVRR